MRGMLKPGKKFFFQDKEKGLQLAAPGQMYELTEQQWGAFGDMFEKVPDGATVMIDAETGEPNVVRTQPAPKADETKPVEAAALTAKK